MAHSSECVDVDADCAPSSVETAHARARPYPSSATTILTRFGCRNILSASLSFLIISYLALGVLACARVHEQGDNETVQT